MGVEVSDVFMTLTPRKRWKHARTQDELVERMAAVLAPFPGMRAIFSQPIEMRMNEIVAGVRSDLGVKLFGEDFAILRNKAAEIERILKRLPGASDVVTEQLTGQPVLEVAVDRGAIARQGIPAGEVLSTVESLGTRSVGVLQEDERRFPITLRLADRYRADAAAVGRIPVAAVNGDRIPLSRLASIRSTEGPSSIEHEWGKRRIVVQANVRGRDVGSLVREARLAIAREVSLPPGYFVRFGGQFEHLESARLRLLIVVPAALALIFLLLYFTYGRVLDAARVFTGVPFAAVGGILALWLRGIPFSIAAGVGFVALSGVAVLADIVLVSTIRQRLSEGPAAASGDRGCGDHAPAARAHDRAGRQHGLRADGAQYGSRRGSAAPARHGRDRRSAVVDALDAVRRPRAVQPARADEASGGLASPQRRLKVTMMIQRTLTGCPSLVAGSNFHCLTQATAASSRRGIDLVTLTFRMLPSASMIVVSMTSPSTFARRASSGYSGLTLVTSLGDRTSPATS
jgi:hypothetical protein